MTDKEQHNYKCLEMLRDIMRCIFTNESLEPSWPMDDNTVEFYDGSKDTLFACAEGLVESAVIRGAQLKCTVNQTGPINYSAWCGLIDGNYHLRIRFDKRFEMVEHNYEDLAV